jgi:hypothetical protein
VKNIDARMLTRVLQELEYRIDVSLSAVVHTSNISRSFGFLVINVRIRGEHYETPCILNYFMCPLIGKENGTLY